MSKRIYTLRKGTICLLLLVMSMSYLCEKDTVVSTNEENDSCDVVDEDMIKKQKEFDELKEWADNLPVLKKQDDKVIKQMKDFVKQQKNRF